jgi:hypothetical protein
MQPDHTYTWLLVLLCLGTASYSATNATFVALWSSQSAATHWSSITPVVDDCYSGSYRHPSPQLPLLHHPRLSLVCLRPCLDSTPRLHMASRIILSRGWRLLHSVVTMQICRRLLTRSTQQPTTNHSPIVLLCPAGFPLDYTSIYSNPCGFTTPNDHHNDSSSLETCGRMTH